MKEQRRTLREHEALRLDLDRLRVLALAPKSALPEPRMRRLLQLECRDLMRKLSRHFALEEKDGYMDDIYARRPNLSQARGAARTARRHRRHAEGS